MTTYYRDAEMSVSSAGIRLPGRELPLASVRQVWHKRGRRSWATIAGRGALGAMILLPLAVGALAVTAALLLHLPTIATVVLIGGGILVGLAVVPVADLLLDRVDRSYDRGSRDLEIWARTRAGDVLLLRTHDAARFGRVYRALQRALEPARV